MDPARATRLTSRPPLLGLIRHRGKACFLGPGVEWRSGPPLPINTWAILPVGDGTLLVGGKLRIDHLPQPGEGIAGKETSSPGEFKSGSLLSPREQAYLLAAGIQNVGVHCLPRVGVLLLGNELTDLKAEKEEGQVYDLNGYWLTSSIQALGLDVIPFGISEDGPEGLRKHLVRCHTRQVDILMISGGTGAGITDRTAEAIREMNGKVLFEKLSLHGCDSLVFGKLNNMDVLALSGRPLSCAAGFDLYGRPLILARSGAAKGYWNWANVLYQDETLTPPPPSNNRQLEWCLQAGKLIGNRSEPVTLPVVKAWNPETLFSPVVPGSEGWILRPPGPLENPVYFSRHSQQVF